MSAPKERVFIALGSNVGEARAHFEAAVQGLAKVATVLGRSRLYLSKPWGAVPDQPDFSNAAVLLEDAPEPLELLEHVQRIEREQGRVRTLRHGPRSLDLDLIFYGARTLEHPMLTLPHPGAHERDFVLHPLCDLDGEFVHPVLGCSLKSLRDQLGDSYICAAAQPW